jgi:hypothetical protein
MSVGRNEKMEKTRTGKTRQQKFAVAVWGRNAKTFSKDMVLVLVLEGRRLISLDGWICNTINRGPLLLGQSTFRVIGNISAKKTSRYRLDNREGSNRARDGPLKSAEFLDKKRRVFYGLALQTELKR